MSRLPYGAMVVDRFVQPMKAVSGALPPGDGWATEIKWDGMRLQVHLRDGIVEVFSGSGRVVTSSFPELVDFSRSVGVDAVLDGEAVVFEGERPSFAALQNRIHVANPSVALLRSYPVVVVMFDLLNLGGTPMLEVPYLDRRRLLTDLVEETTSWRVPSHTEDGGDELLALAADRDLEGVVSKRIDGPYRPGRRSQDWVKTKIRKRQEFVVGGWTTGTGGLSDTIGSLIVGVYEDNELVCAGSVGSGLTDQERTTLSGLLVDGPCPFVQPPANLSGPPHWVEPHVVVEVEYSLWTDGEHLWHPVYRGRRTDRTPTDIVRELPPDSEAN